ncbi:ATP-NAD kinase-like domain-containing protein [Gautieria morchelliformis]|nr:ATP-NAD kinase-like domain-containing protein [Gautieria morchelliformis]
MEVSLLVICNPVSGDGKGRQFVQEHVLPLIQDHDYELQETKEAGAAGRLAVEFLRKQPTGNPNIVLVISGGDGTVHEVINGIGVPSQPLQLVICPHGTANALYSTLFPLLRDELPTLEYRLRSLRAYLEGRTRRLTLTKTCFLDSNNDVTNTLLGVVVASTALHASILDTAEHLRASIPGIDRFKAAAAENISKWYHSHVRLFSRSESIQIYDPIIRAFKPLGSAEFDLPGPFAYFLSTVNVDRLEPAFEITPLFALSPPTRGEMDLVVIRPLRDPSVETDSPNARVAFVQNLTGVLQEAYTQGNHINLRYQNGVPSVAGNGPFVVEYLRCSGWVWTPNEFNIDAHLVCVDGTIVGIPMNGKATCEVLCDSANAHYLVCA